MKRIIIKENQLGLITNIQKPIKGVIFDFDYTLFNTDAVQDIRSIAKHTKGTAKDKALAWENAYKYVGNCELYSGIKELLTYLYSNGIPCCIISMCKPEFVSKTLAAFGLPNMSVYGANLPYQPKNKAMKKFVSSIGIEPNECLSIGDRYSDENESNKANVQFIGCSWGNGHDKDKITNGVKSPLDIVKYIEQIKEQTF